MANICVACELKKISPIKHLSAPSPHRGQPVTALMWVAQKGNKTKFFLSYCVSYYKRSGSKGFKGNKTIRQLRRK
jgi:hypothetical protein